MTAPAPLASVSPRKVPIPRLALRPEEAAAALGVSVDAFRTHVAPELRAVRRGRVRLYAVAELARWLDRESSRALGDDQGLA